jgi:excisionase family DNA binding protein
MHQQTATFDNGQLVNDPRSFRLIKAAYSVNETLNLLSIGRTTFYELVGRGELKITKLGKKTLVYAIDLAALLNKLRQQDEALRVDSKETEK